MGAPKESDEVTGIIKAAKKTLKRQESGSMKIKHLAKSLLEKFSDSQTKSTIRQAIEENDIFHIDGKTVMLKKSNSCSSNGNGSKKRKSSDINGCVKNSNDEEVSNRDDEITKDAKKAEKKEQKKAKKSSLSTITTASSTPDNSSVQAWRKEHKIVLRDPRNDEEGIVATKLLASDALFYPYQTFDTPGCVENIVDTLIRQCTVVNGFTRPSPIQAQCWVSFSRR